MATLPHWRQRLADHLERLRLRLSGAEALPQLSVLGLVTGCIAGAVIIAFRRLVETVQLTFIPGTNPENFEGLDPWARLGLSIGGALIIGLLFQSIPAANRRVGLIHVIERLAYHQGKFPLHNAVVVFVGAALSLISGHSVGREGPSVHLGATCGSQLGLRLKLPHNTLRSLVACGVAAAIAASFNTPLAGVVFAMEVVMREYTVAGFAPVILAAVSATTITRMVYGTAPTFFVPAMEAGTFAELPWMVVIGLVIGTLASIYTFLLAFFSQRLLSVPVWLRITLGGAAVGLCALIVPEVMGIGYDTVNTALLGKLGLGVLISIAAVKLIATTVGLGLGLPGGLIGPTLVIGAAAGGAMGLGIQYMMPAHSSSDTFYTIIGMGAMMGATLQAPLSALTAMLELTANPNIILPGLLTLISSSLTASEIYGTQSAITTLMNAQGIDYHNDPVSQSLRRQGVASAMERHVVSVPRIVAYERVHELLKDSPRWLIVLEDGAPGVMLPGADLARHMNKEGEPETGAEVDAGTVDLLEIPAQRRQIVPVDIQDSLQEAYDTLREAGADAVYVRRSSPGGVQRIYGVLTRQDIEATYGYSPGAKHKET
jgi:CIC family chloride channel protein